MLLKVRVSSVGLPHVIIDITKKLQYITCYLNFKNLTQARIGRAQLSLSKLKFAKGFVIDPASIYSKETGVYRGVVMAESQVKTKTL